MQIPEIEEKDARFAAIIVVTAALADVKDELCALRETLESMRDEDYQWMVVRRKR